jgi:transposase
MTKQRRFTKDFENEAVRLALTSGRTQREIAEDLGVGLSTLVRWLGRSRFSSAVTSGGDDPPGASRARSRLRRENEILRQERDILKRATAFFAREGSR